MLQNDPLRLPSLHFDAGLGPDPDPDHAFHFDADPDFKEKNFFTLENCLCKI
jgi:hypothetical protein